LRLTTIEDPLEETQRPGALRHRRGAAKGKAHAGGVQVAGGFSELPQQSFAGFRGQAVRNAHQVSLLTGGCCKHLFRRHRRAKKNGAPTGGLSQAQKIDHAGDMHTFAQRASDHGFRTACFRHLNRR
jgi:hypothetical protein